MSLPWLLQSDLYLSFVQSLLVFCHTRTLKLLLLRVLAEFVLTLQSEFHQAGFGLSSSSSSFGPFSSLPSLLTVTVSEYVILLNFGHVV